MGTQDKASNEAQDTKGRMRSRSWRRTSGTTALSLIGGLGLVLGGLGVATLGAVVASSPAYAWQGTTTIASTRVVCSTDTGIQTASVTVNNNSGVDAVVTVSSGPIFLVGDTIALPSKMEQFTKPGSFSGAVVLSFSVNYPGHDTTSYPVSPVTITFAGGCEQQTTTTTKEATTTTTETTSTTTAAPTVVVPFVYVPSTVAPTSAVPVQVIQPEVAPSTAAPAQVLGAQLAVTGQDTNLLTWVGLTLLALGLLAVTFGSRRVGSLRRR